MIAEKKDGEIGRNKIAVGYDMGKEYAQISYCIPGDEPRTQPVAAGTEQYNIPLVLCKRRGVNQWFFGKEALRYAQEEEGILVEHLLEKAERGTMEEIEGENFEPVALLALFIKRSLSLLGLQTGTAQIESMVVTVGGLNHRLIEVLDQAAGMMDLKTKHICYQSHMESFYYYTVHQPQELWQHQTVVFDFSGDRMKSYRMECNKRTMPMVAFIEEEEYPDISRGALAGSDKDWDSSFAEAAEHVTEGRIVSTVYLIGEGFQDDWCRNSLKIVCRNRRVFKGNNLFSKGACYGACAKIRDTEADRQYVFLGNDKLKANIGMNVLRRGEASYFALLDAGVNWYEAKKKLEFILEKGNRFSILLTPLTGGEVREVELILDGLGAREDKTTRLSFSIRMLSEKKVLVEMEDLGFGEIVSATHQKWTEEFDI